jgi:hypothetical protein
MYVHGQLPGRQVSEGRGAVTVQTVSGASDGYDNFLEELPPADCRQVQGRQPRVRWAQCARAMYSLSYSYHAQLGFPSLTHCTHASTYTNTHTLAHAGAHIRTHPHTPTHTRSRRTQTRRILSLVTLRHHDRFAVYDFEYRNADDCVFNKLVFVMWSPDGRGGKHAAAAATATHCSPTVYVSLYPLSDTSTCMPHRRCVVVYLCESS